MVDVQCDYIKHSLGDMQTGEVEMAALEATMRTIGEKIPPECLVLIETTVAPGTTEFVAYPILKKAFQARGIDSAPLLAHSYERVMPGRQYVASIRDFWRVCSGCNDEATERVVKFLSEVLNTKEFPLTVLDRPIESETAKIVENCYRATILAFLDEWSLFAERNGVDLTKVIKAIKVRPTHSNMIFPGPGIGGYCLPKDGGLGFWAYKHILGFEDDIFNITTAAIDINDTRALHVAELTRDALRNMGRYIAGSRVLVCGASYREDVGDTRYSGSELVVRKLTEMGAELSVHDPYVEHWYEFETQDTYPATGTPWRASSATRRISRSLRVQKDLAAALEGVEAVIFAVRHSPYLELRARPGGGVGRVQAGRHRLLRHPGRRQDPPLLRAGLRGEGPGPRPHPADQGRGAEGTTESLTPCIGWPARSTDRGSDRATIGKKNLCTAREESTRMPGWLGPWEIAIIVVIILVIFGGSLLPRIGRSAGRKLVGLKKGLKEGGESFKEAVKEDEQEADTADKKPESNKLEVRHDRQAVQ